MKILQTKTTQDFIPLKEIRDGVAILKNGGLRMVLMASSINFALKSPDEQAAILSEYQNFLNSMDFQSQIFMESRRLDIEPYLSTLEARLKDQTTDLIKVQTREYIEFIKNFTENVNVMTKTFFIVVPFEPINLRVSTGVFNKIFSRSSEAITKEDQRQFEEHKTQLEQRAQVVEQGLSRLGIRIVQLGTEELVELYFKIFNPGEKDIPNLEGQV